MGKIFGKSPNEGRAEHDFYATDPIAAKMLLSVEKFDKNIWECASGENHLADVFKQYGYNVRTSDIVKRTPTTEVKDFLECKKKWCGDIITNPPFKYALEFVDRALSLVSNGHKVAMFLRLQFLEGIERHEFFKMNPPKAVYVASKRIKCGKNGDFKSSMSSIQCYAWFVWIKGYKGETTVRWVNVNEGFDERRMMYDDAVDEVSEPQNQPRKKSVRINLGNCLDYLKSLPSHSVDLIITSPPYDGLRTYGGGMTWNTEVFKAIAIELARVLKKGGVIVWNVSDECVKGSYSCTSMRQILYFTDILGLNLHDTMVWQKPNAMTHKRGKRYAASFEPMYVFSKGKPKTFNPIMRECKHGGEERNQNFVSNKGKGYVKCKHVVISKECIDNNVWCIPTATSKETTYTLKDGREIKHTAVFPKELALRHIRTWTNEGDVVLDPFLGSGTSGIAAVELGRSFIGCELNADYFQMASERLEEKMKECGYVNEEEVCKVSEEDTLTPKQKVKVAVGDKHINLFVQRVERNVYEKLALSHLHYMKDPINKGTMCLLFTDSKGRNVAFVGLLNNPSKAYPNAVMVSRIVVFPQFQGKGLSIPILNKVGAMLAAKGLQLFINTEHESFGKRLDSSVCWIGTTFDKKVRKYYGKDDATHRYRKEGLMWRKRLVGMALHGYSHHFEKVAVLRLRKAEAPIMDNSRCAEIRHITPFVDFADTIPCSGTDALSAAPYWRYTDISKQKIKPIKYGSLDILNAKNINIAEYGYFDTS